MDDRWFRLGDHGRYLAYPMKRFSLTSLFLLLTIVAVGYSAWNQRQQQAEIAQLKNRVSVVETDARVRARINDLFKYLDPENDEQMDTLQLVKNLTPLAPNLSQPELHKELASLISCISLMDVDGEPGGLEILSLSNTFITIPGSSYSVNVLFNDEKIVDVLVRRTGTRVETHSVEMLDTNNDGAIDLVLKCTPGFRLSEPASQLNYLATNSGFQLNQAPKNAR